MSLLFLTTSHNVFATASRRLRRNDRRLLASRSVDSSPSKPVPASIIVVQEQPMETVKIKTVHEHHGDGHRKSWNWNDGQGSWGGGVGGNRGGNDGGGGSSGGGE